jgi:HSP20 family protein
VSGKPDITDFRRYAMELSLRRVEETPMGLRREKRLFSDFEGTVDSLFDEVFGGSLVSYLMPETRGMFSPRTDIKETDGNIRITSEMPGIDMKDIDVSVQNGVLTISGEKKAEEEEKHTDYHHVERSYGCFSRRIALPDTVDTGKIEAVHKNGVLTVTLPKTEKAVAQTKKIVVTTA